MGWDTCLAYAYMMLEDIPKALKEVLKMAFEAFELEEFFNKEL